MTWNSGSLRRLAVTLPQSLIDIHERFERYININTNINKNLRIRTKDLARRYRRWLRRRIVRNSNIYMYVYIVSECVCLVSASILHDLSDMQPQINAIKIEHPPYYCSSYTPPSAATAADHAQPAASFSKFQNLHPYLTLLFPPVSRFLKLSCF